MLTHCLSIRRKSTRYRQGHLSVAEFAALDAHVQDCGPCAERLLTAPEKRKATMMLLSEWGESPAHVTYEMLRAYVDQQASEDVRRTIEGHTAFCLRCRNDLQNLRQFRAEIPEQVRVLNLMAAEMPSVSPSPSPAWRLPVWLGSGALGGAAAACLLLWVTVVQPHNREMSRRAGEMALLRTKNTQLAGQISGSVLSTQLAQAQTLLTQSDQKIKELRVQMAVQQQKASDAARRQQAQYATLSARVSVLSTPA